jgi:hypothetical protein
MSVDDNQCFGPCVMSGFEILPALSPVALLVAISPNPTTDRIQR